LKPAFNGFEVSYMSTNQSFGKTVNGNKFYCIPEVSRWNKSKLFKVGFEIAKVISTVKPDVIISTGAAPGVVCLLVGKLKGAKTIWVESMCHVEGISLSGKIAKLFADQVYTQWPQLESSNVLYKGNIMS
jgi:UDP-N-acetylglucosamine:LPS N-acetylglucosamine transferase